MSLSGFNLHIEGFYFYFFHARHMFGCLSWHMMQSCQREPLWEMCTSVPSNVCLCDVKYFRFPAFLVRRAPPPAATSDVDTHPSRSKCVSLKWFLTGCYLTINDLEVDVMDDVRTSFSGGVCMFLLPTVARGYLNPTGNYPISQKAKVDNSGNVTEPDPRAQIPFKNVCWHGRVVYELMRTCDVVGWR